MPVEPLPIRSPMSSILEKPIRIHVLGEFRIFVDGIDKTPLIAYCKPKLLLAVLALAQEKTYARAALADLIWPNGMADARGSLRHALCILRRLLDPIEQALICTPRTVALNPALVEVDALALLGAGPYAGLTLKARLEYDRGELLEHMVSTGNAALSAWKTGWQSRLAQEVSRCRQQDIATLSRQGAAEDAMASARQWVQLHPGDEYAHRSLIRLLRDSCSHEAALRAYEHCAAVMGEYYGAVPSAETQALLRVPAAAWNAPAGQPAGMSDSRPLAILALTLSQEVDGAASDGMADHLQGARRQLLALVQGCGGKVCAGTGGSIAVMFGYPGTIERPAEAAARMAGDIQRYAMPPGVSLAMGIHADLTCVHADNVAESTMLIGQRALRLAYLASPGETLVTESAHARLHERFVVSADERYGLRVGVLHCRAEPQAVRRMFGRAAEFDILIRRWTSAMLDVRSSALLVRGRQGVGKSLLLNVFAEYARHAGAAVRSLRCGQENQRRALHPMRDYLLRRLAPGSAEVSVLEAGEYHRREMESLGYRAGLDKSTSSSLYDYFLHSDGTDQMDYDESGLTALSMSDLASQALIDSLESILMHREKPEQPLLLTIDDLQWADPITMQFIHRLVQTPQPHPTVILLSTRGNHDALPAIEPLVLEPLSSAAMVEMVSARARDKRLAPKIRRRIVEKSGGVPLYAEEMVRQWPLDLDAELTPLIKDLLAARLVD